jgi:hypothetical protein
MDGPRLHVIAVCTGITNMGIRQGHDLTAIRRVSQDFLVTGHGGIEYHFTNGLAIGPDRGAVEDSAILQCKYRWGAQERSSEANSNLDQ